jgi:hypothetical protein
LLFGLVVVRGEELADLEEDLWVGADEGEGWVLEGEVAELGEG